MPNKIPEFEDVFYDASRTFVTGEMTIAEFTENFIERKYDIDQLLELFSNDKPELKYVAFKDKTYESALVEGFVKKAKKIRTDIFNTITQIAFKKKTIDFENLRFPINSDISLALYVLYKANRETYDKIGFTNSDALKNEDVLVKSLDKAKIESDEIEYLFTFDENSRPRYTEKPNRDKYTFKEKIFGRKPQQFKNLAEIKDYLDDTINSKQTLTGETAINIVTNLARLENKRNGAIESRYSMLDKDKKDFVLGEFGQDYTSMMQTVLQITHEKFLLALTEKIDKKRTDKVTDKKLAKKLPDMVHYSPNIDAMIVDFQKKYPAHVFFLEQAIIPALENYADDIKQTRLNTARAKVALHSKIYGVKTPSKLLGPDGKPIMNHQVSGVVLTDKIKKR